MALFSIVVPVYNSEKTLELLYEKIKNVFDNVMHESFELILVDDSSKDCSFAIMHKLHLLDKRVKAISLARNFGQHKALLCGFSYAKGDYVITMDDDLQHPPEEIPKLVEKIRSSDEIDVVIGNYESKKHGLIRNAGTFMTSTITSITFKKNKDLHLTSFRLMKRFVADCMCSMQISAPRIGHLLLAVSNRIVNVTVSHDERKYGKSGYTFKRLTKDFFANIINNSDLPLKLVGYLGVVSLLFSIVLSIYYIIIYFLRGVSIHGFTTLVVLFLLYSGIILFSISIVGKYLIRILSESKKLPVFVVRKEEIESENV